MPGDMTTDVVELTVNGQPTAMPAAGDRSLLSWLRDDLGLTGTKPACGEGVCGACTVLVDGAPVRSCVTRLATLDGRAVTTIEAPPPPASLRRGQAAFEAEGAVQCGYCTPGMIVAAAALLERTAVPDDAAIVTALDGHICRCGTYARIARAVHRAASGDVEVDADPDASDAHLINQPVIDAADAPWD